LSRIFKNLAIYLLIVLIAVAAIRWTSPSEQPQKPLTYDQFTISVRQDKVKDVVIITRPTSVTSTVH
jgi:cell division protease FtsH